MGEEDLDRAIELLDFVLKAEPDLGDQRLAAIAHFWKGRSHRKKGEYDAAMEHVVKGRSLMQAIPAPKLGGGHPDPGELAFVPEGRIGGGDAPSRRGKGATR